MSLPNPFVHPIVIFDLLRIIPVIVTLMYAASQDYHTGIVRNRTWLYFPFGLLFTVIELVILPQLFLVSAVSVVIAVVAGLALFSFKGWGGADFKAILTIAICTPLTPLLSSLVTLLPVFTLFIASLIAISVTVLKHKKVNDKIHFLPYLLVGYVLACLI